jgi:hypothetical protein
MRFALMSIFDVCAWGQLKFDIHPVTGRVSDRLKRRSAWRDGSAPDMRFRMVRPFAGVP